MELWKSSWIQMIPPTSPIMGPQDNCPLIYVVALGVLQLQADPDAEDQPSPFSLKTGTLLFPGDSVTTDDLHRAGAIAAASADSDALALELNRTEYLRLLNAVRHDHADRIRAFVVAHILPPAGGPDTTPSSPAADRGPAGPAPADPDRGRPPGADDDRALAHLLRIFALRRVAAGAAAAAQGAPVEDLLWVERGACVAVVAFGPRHCTSASAPGVPTPGGPSRRCVRAVRATAWRRAGRRHDSLAPWGESESPGWESAAGPSRWPDPGQRL